MSPQDLDKMAHDLIAGKIQSGEEVLMHWAVHELIAMQGSIEGDASEFFHLCAKEHVYRVVKKAVDRYEDQSGTGHDDDQMVLDGYEHLQEAYTVERGGSRALVPIHLVSDDELLARADQFDKQAEGIKRHAREIRDYVKARRNSASA